MSRNMLFALAVCASLFLGARWPEVQYVPACGNGVRDPGEQCDDGNTTNLDGCSSQCKFEQSQRINLFKMQFVAAPSCSANAFGSAFAAMPVQSNLQSGLDSGITSGAISIIFHMVGLDDLSGTADNAVAVGVVKGTPVAGASYSGNNDPDWWYKIDPNGLDANRVPLDQLNGSIATKILTAGPGNATIPFLFAGPIANLRMSSLRLSAAVGAASVPLVSSGTPPGHLPAENLDPSLQSYASSGRDLVNLSSGELCGNASAASLVLIPVPSSLLNGGATACTEGYTAANSMLDVLVGGCHVLGGFIPAITATQPDQEDLSAPVAGHVGPYRLSAPSNHQVTVCKDKNNTPVNDLNACLNAAAYSSFFKFSTDRVIAGRAAPPVVTQVNPNIGPAGGGQPVTITGSNLDDAKVTIGGTDAIVSTAVSGSVTFTTPAHAAATVDVIVTTLGGSGKTTGGYTYVAAPAAPAGLTAAAVSNNRIDVAWMPVSGANSYELDRKVPGSNFALLTTTAGSTSYSDTTSVSPNTSYLYRVRAVSAGGASPNSSPALATVFFMANDPLPSANPIRAIHLSQLRLAVNFVRVLAGLPAATVTDVAQAGTNIKAIHITELRTALDEARMPLGLSTGGYADPSLNGIRVKAIHFQELRAAAGTSPLPAAPSAIVVNEVSTGAASSASNEFVEIFNNSSSGAVDLSDWKVVYRAAAAGSDTLLATIPPGTIIQPNAFYLLGGSAYAGAGAADQTFTNGLAAVGGAVGVRNASGALVDSVGWGTATNAFVETSVATAPSAGSSIGRKPDGTDSNNNANDFKVSAALTPRSPNQ